MTACRDATTLTTDEALHGWRFVLGSLRTTVRTGSLAEAAALAALLAPEIADAPVRIDLCQPGWLLITVGHRGVREADARLAARLAVLAVDRGYTLDPTATQALELAIDTPDPARIRPFWAAVLGYDDRDGELHDPFGRDMSVWFQHSDAHAGRGRLHVDISVPHDVAEQRIAAALSAGGELVSDQHARAWWVLRDPDGNEACISTWQDR